MEDSSEAAEADGWLSILIASSAPSIAQWADIVQNLLCHTNAAKGLFCFFIFKMGFGMSFHFQNVVLFQKVFSFSKCERFHEVFFLFPKNPIVNKTL